MKILKNIIGLSILATSASLLYTAYKKPTSKKRYSSNNDTAERNDKVSNIERNTSSAIRDFDARTQKMIKELEMTEAQQRKFEASIKAVRDDLSNGNSQMTAEDIRREEGKHLNSILNEIQYGMYRDWAQQN
ncbi:hypothetical protein [Winogradskyella forsetii]|uniref:hypothetical protein n=1 Tax=Winogradskyella forsetii TaxID=2686077 RepID=UPI0015BB730A|nr:hypothetical protein [Winogradskyella forsetii]